MDYNISNNLTLKTSLYKTEIYDRIEFNAAYTQHENLKTNINQEGIENEIALTNKFRSFSVFSNFSKAGKTMVKHKTEGQIFLMVQSIEVKYLIII